MTTSLTIRINEKVKRDAQKFAKATGLSLSTIIENQLQAVVKEGRIEFVEYKEPTPESESIVQRFNEDLKAGKVDSYPTYNSMDEAIDHLKTLM